MADVSPDQTSQPDEHLIIAIPKTSAAPQTSDDLRSADIHHTQVMATPVGAGSEDIRNPMADARSTISNLLKDKEQEWTAVAEKTGPLQLLDLPMDILKEIVKEITHTNDLTALALTHSALHNLAIPHIYSRFDIVWPDAHATTDPRTGVDALTYGLATLCMGDVLSSPKPGSPAPQFPCTNCGALNVTHCSHTSSFFPAPGQRRIGNQYPQFTRKFSLGNGPADWVQEYLITKESGKMLGTLVALAVARMMNLETFVWDMPTGVLRDVWLALSSLQARAPNQECRLERVWVRWHDNSDPANMPSPQNSNTASNTTPQMLAGSTMTPIGWNIPAGSVPSSQQLPRRSSYSQSRVEYPTLSVLPPLKSLSVLDIDELDYLDEMSVLIAKSKECIRELRVGISTKASNRDFALAWDGPDLHQVDHAASWPGASTIGERRLGGVLGVLLGRVFDIRRKQRSKTDKKDSSMSVASSTPIPPEHQPTTQTTPTDFQNDISQHIDVADVSPIGSPTEGLASGADAAPEEETNDLTLVSPPAVPFNLSTTTPFSTADGLGLNPHQQSPNTLDSAQSDIESLSALMSAHEVNQNLEQSNPALEPETIPALQPLRRSKPQGQRHSHFSETPSTERQKLEGKLRLQILELERIPLSITVLQKAFDWSVMTDLTILDCPQHDRLWVMLRRQFQPTPVGGSHSSSKHHSGATMQYHLNLKKIHTDAASPALISFLKDTLAPNSLETLFLQDRRRSTGTSVTIDAIYRGPLKRHRASLKRVMLDSSDRIPRGPTSSSDNARWRAWMPTRDILNFITSGRMSSLRELSIAIEYKDWHHFLQRLLHIPQLRSLNVPFIADHVTPAFDPKELALQVVDIIVLRPEVELCYIGISHKCFEILENRPHEENHTSGDPLSSTGNGGEAVTDDEEDDDDDDGSDEEEEEEEDDTGMVAPAGIDPDETESDMSEHDDSDTDSFISDYSSSKVRLRLREILFYDDKVAVFKARHGRL